VCVVVPGSEANRELHHSATRSPLRRHKRTLLIQGAMLFRRPSMNSFAFDGPPRSMYADIVKAGSVSSTRAAASRVSSSHPRWAKACGDSGRPPNRRGFELPAVGRTARRTASRPCRPSTTVSSCALADRRLCRPPRDRDRPLPCRGSRKCPAGLHVPRHRPQNPEVFADVDVLVDDDELLSRTSARAPTLLT
jgi:hypothetical protein